MKSNRLAKCLSRLPRASLREVLLGEHPWPMFLLLLTSGMALLVLARDALPAMLAVVLLGVLANAWLWCNETDPDATGEPDREP